MISKFFNWVFGSFFRTAGRFLFYFLLFFLLSFLIHSCEANAAEPDLSNLSFRGLGVGNAKLNCSTSLTNCYWEDYGFDLMSIGASHNFNVTSSPIVPVGLTFNLYNGGVFISGYVYTLEFTFYDNASNIEYYRQWSYSLTSGYDNFSATNSYAEIKNTRVTRSGNNITISIDFIAKDWFRYLRVVARAPFNQSEDNIYPDITYVEQDIVYNSLKTSGTYTFVMQNYNLTYMPDYEYKNSEQNESIINNQQQTNEKLDETNENLNKVDESINNMNDSLTSTEGADLGALQNSAGWLPPGPVDSILNLPLSLMNNLTTNLNKSCSPLVVPIPFVDKDLRIPCLNTIYESIDGLNVWITTISIIASGFILYSYFLKLYKWVEDTLMFNDNSGLSSWGGV